MPSRYKGTQKQILALDTFIKLNRAVNSFNSRMTQRRTQGELSPSQFAVMETLLHLGPMCQTHISQKLLLSTGNITMVIDNLEKHGYVTRERNSDDRRFVTVSLTPAGEALISGIFPAHADAIREEMSVLSEDEQRQLGALCKKLGIGSLD
jgi:MarR family 2-MHQ and catechol resistance regulon transcriptional repressor